MILLAAHWSEPDIPELASTVTWLRQRGNTVTVVGPGMEYDTPLPGVLFDSIRDHNPGEVQLHWVNENRVLDKKMEIFARDEWKVGYISEFEDMCGTSPQLGTTRAQAETIQGCPLYASPGVPLIFDRFHLTPPGSILFAESMREHHQLE
jgi:hypothetical protein